LYFLSVAIFNKPTYLLNTCFKTPANHKLEEHDQKF